jgi:hypothetical protein
VVTEGHRREDFAARVGGGSRFDILDAYDDLD